VSLKKAFEWRENLLILIFQGLMLGVNFKAANIEKRIRDFQI
jgi:hypothetical protein